MSAEGTEYQTEMRCVRMNSAKRTGKVESRSGTRTIVAPAAIVVKTSRIERSKCSGA